MPRRSRQGERRTPNASTRAIRADRLIAAEEALRVLRTTGSLQAATQYIRQRERPVDPLPLADDHQRHSSATAEILALPTPGNSRTARRRRLRRLHQAAAQDRLSGIPVPSNLSLSTPVGPAASVAATPTDRERELVSDGWAVRRRPLAELRTWPLPSPAANVSDRAAHRLTPAANANVPAANSLSVGIPLAITPPALAPPPSSLSATTAIPEQRPDLSLALHLDAEFLDRLAFIITAAEHYATALRVVERDIFLAAFHDPEDTPREFVARANARNTPWTGDRYLQVIDPSGNIFAVPRTPRSVSIVSELANPRVSTQALIHEFRHVHTPAQARGLGWQITLATLPLPLHASEEPEVLNLEAERNPPTLRQNPFTFQYRPLPDGSDYVGPRTLGVTPQGRFQWLAPTNLTPERRDEFETRAQRQLRRLLGDRGVRVPHNTGYYELTSIVDQLNSELSRNVDTHVAASVEWEFREFGEPVDEAPALAVLHTFRLPFEEHPIDYRVWQLYHRLAIAARRGALPPLVHLRLNAIRRPRERHPAGSDNQRGG